tara:strand:+ start:9053 stop:9409 length:357 start_codon:yes stop_codon:yes gene_type:complete
MSYEFEMPWPPSVNGYWRTFRNRQIISKRGREYRKSALLLLDSMDLSNEKLSSRLSVSVTLNPPTLRKYDVDNFTKAAFDALSVANFWIDDEQVDRLIVTKGIKTQGGNIQIKVEVIQ